MTRLQWFFMQRKVNFKGWHFEFTTHGERRVFRGQQVWRRISTTVFVTLRVVRVKCLVSLWCIITSVQRDNALNSDEENWIWTKERSQYYLHCGSQCFQHNMIKGEKPKASKPSLDQNISQSKLNILKGDMIQEFTLEKLTLIQLFWRHW